jgi:hypothetical protein
MLHPVPRNGRAIANPDFVETLNVVEKPSQGADSTRSTDDAVMETDGHHPAPSLTTDAVQPIECIPAVCEEVSARGEVASALQA